LAQFTLVVVCMIAARTWAMVVNRLADRALDASNPRTAGRVFAAGEVGISTGHAVLAASGGTFIIACALFGVLFANWWPVALSVPVLGWIGLYSFTKRWTWWCHVFLGSTLAASPLAAALAVEPTTLAEMAGVWWIALMVLCWVAGFDVIYSLQDLEFDRSAGLNSVPARFGWRRALWVSRGLHVLSVAALLMAVASEPGLGWLTAVGAFMVALVLLVEHRVLSVRGKAGIPMAFFTLNGVVSVLLGTLGVLDVLVW